MSNSDLAISQNTEMPDSGTERSDDDAVENKDKDLSNFLEACKKHLDKGDIKKCIILEENGFDSIDLTSADWIPSAALTPLKLKLSRVQSLPKGPVICTIKASEWVGAAELSDGKVKIPFLVRPKIEVDHLAYMILWANGYRPFEPTSRTPYVRSRSDFRLVLPRMFLDETKHLVNVLLRKNLRRTYIEWHDELKGRIKGRPEIQLYLKRNLPQLRNQDIPCSWWDLNRDNDYNRALKLGLEICRQAIRHIQSYYNPDDRKMPGFLEFEREISKISRVFEGITLDPQAANKINRLRPVGNFKRYRDSLEILKLLLKYYDYNISGDEFHLKGFAIEMHEVFEKCVVNYLAAHLENKMGFLTKDSYETIKIQIEPCKKNEQSATSYLKRIEPDAIIIDQSDKTVILDTKWKEAFEFRETDDLTESIPGLEYLKIRNSDLYQMVAYGMHHKVNAKSAILVYPLETESADPPPDRYTVKGFGRNGEEYPIHIVGLPMKGNLSDSLKNLCRQVQDICAIDSES